MNQDRFFTQSNCDRCSESLNGKSRTCSWFTEECICDDCSKKEKEIKAKLRDNGQSDHEGCGFVPKI